MSTIGRKVEISVGGSPLAVCRTKSLTINNELIDITTDNDDGVRALLDEPGEKTVEVSIEGIGNQSALATIALSADVGVAVVLDYTAYTISGDFCMASYSESLPYKESVTFSASLQSNGAILKSA